jgi:hypothetical protein
MCAQIERCLSEVRCGLFRIRVPAYRRYLLAGKVFRAVHTVFGWLGWGIVRYGPSQREILRRDPGRNYRDLVIEEALVLPKGELSFEEMVFLGALAGRLDGPGPIIEIGTLFGRSTMVMALNKPAGRPLITVDNYSWNPLHLPPHRHYSITRQILYEAIEKADVRQVNMDKKDFYRSYNGGPPAMVFLDAKHSYEETSADIAWARRIMAKVVCGHDYRIEGVRKAVEEAGGAKEIGGSIWVL